MADSVQEISMSDSEDTLSLSSQRHLSQVNPSSPSARDTPVVGRRVVRDVNWRDAETFRLLQIKRDIAEESCRSRFNTNLWAQVSQRMHDSGFQRTAYQCITRWRRLVQRYHELKREYRNSPQQVRTWPYYQEMEEQMEAAERRANLPRRSATGRRRGGSLSVPAVSPVMTSTPPTYHGDTRSMASPFIARSPQTNRRIHREMINPYTLATTPEDSVLQLASFEDGQVHSADEESACVLTSLRRANRASFSTTQSTTLPPLTSIHTLTTPRSIAHPFTQSHPMSPMSANRHTPLPHVASLDSIVAQSHQHGTGPQLATSFTSASQGYSPRSATAATHSSTSTSPPYESGGVGKHGGGGPLSGSHQSPSTSNTSPKSNLPNHSIFSSNAHLRGSLVGGSSLVSTPPSDIVYLLTETLAILKDNQHSMSQLHTRLLQELQNQRTEYSIIRKETREEFNQYIEELRQERRQCHTLISDNQERFVNLVRDLCADLTSKLTTEESAATPGSRSSEGGGGDSSPQTMETV